MNLFTKLHKFVKTSFALRVYLLLLLLTKFNKYPAKDTIAFKEKTTVVHFIHADTRLLDTYLILTLHD